MSCKFLYFPPLKRRAKYSAYRHYKDYRQEIRADCLGRCVYCDAHENEIGGVENMTLDHFRPRDKYSHLEHEPTNLLWACHKCNEFKKNLWPAYGTSHTVVGNKGFIDPFKENLQDYFDILPDGQLEALKTPASYMIKILKLNRTGAKKVREKRNKTYESAEKYKVFLIESIKRVNNWLSRDSLPEEDRKELFQHKVALELQYDAIMKDFRLDLNLY